jgi:hypothetical protein
MNKTHVPDSPITGCQYQNHQVALRFCARRGVGRSADRVPDQVLEGVSQVPAETWCVFAL